LKLLAKRTIKKLCLNVLYKKRYGLTMTRLAVALLVALSFAPPSGALEIICPERIVTTQSLDKQEVGWQDFVRPNGAEGADKHAYASGISMYSDHPKKLVELKPDNEMAKNPSWSFTKATPEAQPLYIACHYFETRIQFVKALPKNVKKCTSKRGGILQCDVFK
jgi:hypothetical protein